VLQTSLSRARRELEVLQVTINLDCMRDVFLIQCSKVTEEKLAVKVFCGLLADLPEFHGLPRIWPSEVDVEAQQLNARGFLY